MKTAVTMRRKTYTGGQNTALLMAMQDILTLPHTILQYVFLTQAATLFFEMR
jgi:hypothetical protein